MSGQAVVRCPGCERRVRYEPRGETAEKVRVRCPLCGTRFIIRLRPGGVPHTPAPPGARTVAEQAGTPPSVHSPAPAHTATQRTERSPAAPARRPWGLASGAVLGGRFRLVRPLGRGGMGEVFEAEDLELGERVALKTIRPDLAGQTLTLQRFRREVQMARRVTHRNVCRIFDVFHHQGDGAGEAGEVVFLTMELLQGEPLDRRLVREGPLALPDALEIARQLASALDAAHEAGIVHRDLKSANVMLVKEADGATRVVVTDFGLARPQMGDPMAALTVDGSALGTPDYMAPEQVERGEVTAAADLYAFGITLYEMVTGRRPFIGNSPLTTAVKRLREPPPPPSDFRPDLEPAWESAILRCLERAPENRFPSAGEAVEALESDAPQVSVAVEESTLPPAVPAKPSRSRREWLMIAGLSLVIVAAVGVALYRTIRWEPSGESVRQLVGLPSGETVARSSVAVLDLKDLTGGEDTAWLATAIAEMLRAELRGGEDLRVLEGGTVARLAPDVASTSGGQGLDRETLQRLRRGLGSEYVVAGSYLTLGDGEGRQVRVDLRVYDTTAGEMLASVSESAAENELFDLVTKAGETLRRGLGVAAGAVAERDPRQALPTTPEAAKLYAESLARFQRFEPLEAKDLLERAVEIEPMNPLIHAGLSLAWTELGYQERARQAARRAMELSEQLPRDVRLSIEARFFQVQGRWDRAAETYRNLWALYPDEVEYGLRLADCQLRAGGIDRALTAVAALRTLGPPAAEDPRVDLVEARAAGVSGAFERQLEAARRAEARAAEQETEALVAQARLLSCQALRNLGHPNQAHSACAGALDLFAARGDRVGESASLVGIAGVLYEQGDLTGARSRFEEALTLNRETGNQGGVAAVLNNLAVVLRNQGDPGRARALYEEALGITRETGDRAGEGHASTNLCLLSLQQGKLSRSRQLADSALEIFRSIGDRGAEATVVDLQGVVARLEGDLDEAVRLHTEALAIRRESGQPRGEATSLKNLGRAALDRGDLDAAGTRFEEALEVSRQGGHPDLEAAALVGLGEVQLERDQLEEADTRQRLALRLREEMGQPGAAAESRVALARIALEAGRAEAAADLAHQAVAELAAQGLEDDRARALATEAAALRILGRLTEARSVIDEARAVVDEGESRGVKLQVTIEEARIALAGGDGESAVRVLDEARREAESTGLGGLTLEARLARAEALAASGAEGAGQALEAVARDAEATGHLRLNRRARALAGALSERRASDAQGRRSTSTGAV